MGLIFINPIYDIINTVKLKNYYCSLIGSGFIGY